jgi:hypothetical protein
MESARLSQALAAAGACICICFALGASAPSAVGEPLIYQSSFGPGGTATASTDFDKVGSVAVDQQTGAVYVLDRAAGTLYKFDSEGKALNFGGNEPYIAENRITGLSFFSGPNESQVAVNSATHVIYVTSGNSLVAFEENGEPAEFTAGSAAGTNAISGFGELIGVAVDANGSIYTSDFRDASIRIYSATGEFLTQFETGTPANLAVAPDGSVYVSRYLSSVLKFTPSEFPVTTSTLYTAAAEPLDEATSQTVAVDPSTGDVYVSELLAGSFEFTHILVYDAGGSLISTFGGPGEEGELAGVSPGIAIDGSSGRVYVSTDDEVGTRSQVEIFAPEVIFVGPPTVVGSSATAVTADSATLRASINPNTKSTTYHFEYGQQDCSLEPDTCTALPNGSTGSGHEPVAVSQPISGLQANTTYHYRVIAENELGVTEGPDQTFITQGRGLGFQLSDSRVWEMVSPSQKAGGVVLALGAGIVQADENGDGLAYSSIGSVDADPEGNRAIEPSTVLARRGSDGWRSVDITPPHSKSTTLATGSEYDVFTPDLSKVLLEPRDSTPLSPAASERTPYLRNNSEPPVYTPLVTSKEGFANVPPGTVFGGDELHGQVSDVFVAGGNPGLTHVVLASKVPLVSGPSPEGRTLYEWSAGQLQPVSLLPEAEGGGLSQGFLGSDQGSVHRAVSDDGSRVFWSPGNIGTASINFTALYLRDTVEGVSSRLDLPQGGTGAGANRPAFQGASADGAVVFFTDSQQLTPDASPEGRDLYRCEIPQGDAAAGCSSLTDISAPLAGSGESAEVQGLVSAVSAEGSRAYFVADGVLSTGSNEAGDAAEAGEPNLYLWEEGEGLRFIATLSPEDDRDWGLVHGNTPGYTMNLSAAASPSGRYFAFMSELSLTGYENRSEGSGPRNEEVFRYDADTDALACVSCIPSGASPDASQTPPDTVDIHSLWGGRSVGALLPEATISGGGQLARYPLYLPRAVLDNGRVFFNSADGLVPADSNRDWDVYQFESMGTGSCSSSSGGAAIANIAGACVSLMSSGAAEEPSAFLDASASGDDVFFITTDQLSVLDKDTANDVYDARVNGTPAAQPSGSNCSGEACQPATGTPNDPIPASEAFRGPEGTVKCPRGKRRVRRHGNVRCVRKHRHHHHAKRHGKRAGNGGGAHR